MAGQNSPSANDNSGKKISYLGYFFISIVFLIVGIGLFFWLSSNPEMTDSFGGLGTFIVLLVISMAFAAFIFGTMQSYANYTGKQFSGNLRLSGPVVGAALVMIGGYYFLQDSKSTPDTPPDDSKNPRIDIEFSLKYADSAQTQIFNKDKVIYIQQTPSGKRYTLVPQVDHDSYGEYIREHVVLPKAGESYKAKVRRTFNGSTLIDPDSIPAAFICFTLNEIPRDELQYTIQYYCEEDKPGKLIDAYDWVENCSDPMAFFSTGSSFRFFNTAYAATPRQKRGWGVPSLSTLKEKHQKQGTSYTGFKITSKQLEGLEQATSFTYQIYVNKTPVYIDGLTKEDIQEEFDSAQGINIEFGLENLDFSGAHTGKEILTVVFYFYSDEELLKTLEIERSYVALRNVSPEVVTSGNNAFNWDGEYVIGRQEDRYEIFIWSSEKPEEITNRKNRFDRANLKYRGRSAISVIRPPLNANESYGLIVGLVDKIGKIKFTFSRQDAQQILNWVKSDVRKIRPPVVRPDTYLRKLTGK